MTEPFKCPDCGLPWPEPLVPCSGCGLRWEDVEAAAGTYDILTRRLPHAATTWPPGILSRVSREAYNAVTRARGFAYMTPDEREAAARSYDQLGGKP